MTVKLRATGPERDARIVVVDDYEANVSVLRQLLSRHGYQRLVTTTDPSEGVELCSAEPTDLLLVDLHMPSLDGLEVIGELKARGERCPIIVLTADIASESRAAAMDAGACDYLSKPFELGKVLSRIDDHLQLRALQAQLRATEEDPARRELLERMALLAEGSSDEVLGHVRRVARLCGLLAGALGLSQREAELIADAALVHDIGNIGVPESIRAQPRSLEPDELADVRRHAVLSSRILAPESSPVLRTATEIAGSHHERWEGRGYPGGLVGDGIPLPGRIVAVADVYDSLTHARPHRAAFSGAEAVEHIYGGSGTRFDPEVVAAFATLEDRDLLSASGLPDA